MLTHRSSVIDIRLHVIDQPDLERVTCCSFVRRTRFNPAIGLRRRPNGVIDECQEISNRSSRRDRRRFGIILVDLLEMRVCARCPAIGVIAAHHYLGAGDIIFVGSQRTPL